MTGRSFERLLRPKSIAVVGGEIAASVIRTLRRGGYGGMIHAIHSSRSEIEGVRTVESVECLDDPPDATFIAVNRKASIEVVAALRRQGAGGAIAYASGYGETGTVGRSLEQQLVQAAGDMPVIGPNAYGLINYLDGAALWLDHHGGQRCERGVAIIGQSSNVLINLTMQRRALPIGYVLALGNQACVDAADLVDAMVEDERVTAIGLHLEGIARPGALAAAVARARAAGRAVVILKSGRSEDGASRAVSHTAAIVGADGVLDAWLKRIGVPRLHRLEAFIETLKLLHVHGPLPDRSFVSLSCSGGEATLVADAAASRDVELRDFTDADRQRIAATANPLVAITNPLDYHTFDWLKPERLRATFEAVLAAGHALAGLVLDMPRTDRCPDDEWLAVLVAWQAAGRNAQARLAVIASMAEGMPEELAGALIVRGVAPLCGIDDALDAIAAAAMSARMSRPFESIGADRYPSQRSTSPARNRIHAVDEAEAKRMLAVYGVEVPLNQPVRSVQAAIDTAAGMKGAVALKALGAEIAHKTEMGGVCLGLRDPGSIELACRRLLALSPRILVERMVEDNRAELLVAVRRDPALGLYLVIGTGGTMAEIVEDVRILVLPTTADEVREAILELRTAPCFSGWRGAEPASIEAAVRSISAVVGFAIARKDDLFELEINPLIVTGSRAVAADALLRFLSGEQP
ncbi:MAG: acetate--CoA ligase family protein [Geminicoccaceae bacterium]|nr:acetate--CoA ligase family protein [Geminicoccaceae bacterium]